LTVTAGVSDRQAGPRGGLARRVLPAAGGEHLAENQFVDLRRAAAAFQQAAHHRGAEVDGGKRGEGAAKAADGVRPQQQSQFGHGPPQLKRISRRRPDDQASGRFTHHFVGADARGHFAQDKRPSTISSRARSVSTRRIQPTPVSGKVQRGSSLDSPFLRRGSSPR
jgi:hypothetical protein